MAAEIALYLHIPFCKVRCSYCAFNVIVGRDILMPDFVTALRREMRLVRAAAPDPLEAQTLYFGGGTPSLLSPEQINALIETARTDYALVPGAEITLEANPDDLTWEKLKGYRSAGVNRISIGVQSTAAHDLDLFRRTHDALAAERAVKLAKDAGIDSTSVDLIYGVPGQTLHTWASTLDEVLGWRPDHLSLYSLIVERGTWLGSAIRNHRIAPPDDDLAADMYALARGRLAAAGYAQYEIASFARPGHESRHNIHYWLNRPFLGMGPGAHGYAAGIRYSTLRSVPRYIERIMQGKTDDFPRSPAFAECEPIDRRTAMIETVFLGLRLVRDGLDLAAFEQRFSVSVGDVFGETVERLAAQGLIVLSPGRIHLAEHTYLVSNQVFSAFVTG